MWRGEIVNNSGRTDVVQVVAQTLRDSGGDLDLSKFAPMVIGLLAGLIILVAIWRGAKQYLETGKNGADVTPEERTKKQAAIVIDAGITIGFISIGAIVIGLVVNFFIKLAG